MFVQVYETCLSVFVVDVCVAYFPEAHLTAVTMFKLALLLFVTCFAQSVAIYLFVLSGTWGDERSPSVL